MDGIVSAITVAKMPTIIIETRITQIISISEARMRKISLYTLRANIEAADKTDESADDITAEKQNDLSLLIGSTCGAALFLTRRNGTKAKEGHKVWCEVL